MSLAHVRTSSIRHFFSPSRSFQREIYKGALDLLSELPEDALTWFEILAGLTRNSAIRNAAHRRHKRIANCQYFIGLNSGHQDGSAAPQGKNDLAHVTCLQLFICSTKNLDQLVWLLENTPSLSRVEITCPERHPNSLEGLSTPLFRSRNRLHQRPLRLQALCFESIDSEEVAHVLLDLFDFEAIKHLRLLGCGSIQFLLESMRTLELSISSLRIDGFACDPRGGTLALTVNNLLRSLKSIRTVCLRITYISRKGNPTSDLDWSALYAAAPAMECLEIDIRQEEIPSQRGECFRSIAANPIENNPSVHGFVKRATNLRQLSLTGIPAMERNQEEFSQRDIASMMASPITVVAKTSCPWNSD